MVDATAISVIPDDLPPSVDTLSHGSFGAEGIV